MKLSLPLIFSMLLIVCCPSMAAEDARFFEFPWGYDQTLIYDLRTVHTIQPGRFTIVSTLIDDGDRMAFELKALDTLRTYCKRPAGKYPPPADVFTLGPADLPIKDIEVESKNDESSPGRSRQYKAATWSYPYKRFTGEQRGENSSQWHVFFACKDLDREEWDLYREKRAEITDGERRRQLFDCKRGLYDTMGVPFIDGEEPSTALMQKMMQPEPVPPPHTNGHRLYNEICLRVTHEKPYSPE
jgi:hypothetical protein